MFTSQSNRGFVLTIFVSLILALGIVYIILSVEQQSRDGSPSASEPLRFSELAGTDEPPRLGTDFVFTAFLNVDPAVYEIDPPMRQTIERDLAVLRERRAERTPELLAQAEREFTDAYALTLPSGQTISEHLADREGTVMTEQMLAELLPEAEEYSRRLQTTADGPHVSQLDPELPAFETPVVPGYPSLPTLRAEVLARIMADIDGANADQYSAAASGLARRLEVAGVAYPAANAAAVAYADAFFAAVSESGVYRTLAVAAAAEWTETE